jgi:hypothetical protein
VARIGRPVINHPDAVFETTRQKTALLLQGVPNLKLPRIMRYRPIDTPIERIVADIDERFAYPVIVRKALGHESSYSLLPGREKVALRVDSPAELRAHLNSCGWREFYAVEYVDLRRPDGCYRKMRAMLVDRQVIVTQAAMYREWMVSGWRRNPVGIAFYREHPHTIEECNRIVLDPAGCLGREAMAVLEAIGERLPLDIFGVDFDVDADGRVVFFEASPAMVVVRDEGVPADIQQPVEPVDRFNAEVARLIDRRAGLARID